MAKVKIKGLDKEVQSLRLDILNAVQRSNFNERLAKDVAAEIRKNGIEPGLEPSTRRFRGKVSSRKGPNFSPSRSSLTLSGQLLGALRSFFNRKKAVFGFFVQTGSHKPYRVKGKKKTYETGGGRLKDIFEGVSKKRPVTKVFDRFDFKQTTERKLVAAIKRYFRKS